MKTLSTTQKRILNNLKERYKKDFNKPMPKELEKLTIKDLFNI